MFVDFFIIFAFHCLADYPLQGEFLAQMKHKSIVVLACHSAIYTMCILASYVLLCHIHGYNVAQVVPLEGMILATFLPHFIIDFAKCQARNKLYEGKDPANPDRETWNKDLTLFYKDQISHIFLICLVWWFAVFTHY